MNKIIVAGLLSSAGVYCYFLFRNPLSKPVIKPLSKPVVIPKNKNVSTKKKEEIKPIPEPVISLKPRLKIHFSDDIIYKDIKEDKTDIKIKTPDKSDWELIHKIIN
tara:strand:- start:403 stop:720 length:318 start_codon:yes stop_codon:yes gene_type:complete